MGTGAGVEEGRGFRGLRNLDWAGRWRGGEIGSVSCGLDCSDGWGMSQTWPCATLNPLVCFFSLNLFLIGFLLLHLQLGIWMSGPFRKSQGSFSTLIQTLQTTVFTSHSRLEIRTHFINR